MNDTRHPITLPTLSFGDEPFADSLAAQARANRQQAAKAAFARRAEERAQAGRLRKKPRNKARASGVVLAHAQGHTRAWYWGLLRAAMQWLWHARKPG